MNRYVYLLFCGLSTAGSWAAELETIAGVDAQPLHAQTARVEAALTFLGAPLPADDTQSLAIARTAGAEKSVRQLQETLDQHVLASVHINPESRVKVAAGPAKPILTRHGWTVFLIKVHNEAGVTARLRVQSPNAAPLHRRSTGAKTGDKSIDPAAVANRWLDVSTFDKQPLNPALSGLEVEYRILQLYSRDAGKREAKLKFDVGQGTQDLGLRNELPVLFTCQPAVKVELDVLDDDGQPTMAQFVFKDAQGRVYPARSRRLAPDFFFHDQVYRAHGEHLFLPPGDYSVTYSRGPEYLVSQKKVSVPAGEETHRESFRLKRWIKLTDRGWYSGDHHVHAAGCAHYESPTEGVTPEDMMRHILGEDLNVGCVLSWGPCWYHQKQFFQGDVSALSQPRYLMRYDVEVSGFPSSHAGHLCLLRLKEDDYPGTTRVEEWPSWDLPVLRWGKDQGGVVGFSHSGWGLAVEGDQLPNYNMPPFDGIGANEYIVDVTHDVCDFISAVDTPAVWELNIWYHTLNCGYTCRISGETDFPCIYGERVGLGRAYVKLEEGPDGSPLNFDRWVQGLKDGRSYCCDGLSHLYDFQVNGQGVGERGKDGRASVLQASVGDKLKIQVQAAAHLEEQPREDIRSRPLSAKPYWHVERARIGNSRQTPVELIVNGEPVATKNIDANGSVHSLEFDYELKQSSWVALRIFPSCHTNPVFVEADGAPIRANLKSAEWCRKAVDVCWNAKKGRIRAEELDAATKAYDHAREAYDRIIKEAQAAN